MGWHRTGTRYGIGMDAADGLLRAGEPGVQLTWMDAKVGDRVVTPRTGKPVEINALWYNALRVMAGFARRRAGPMAWDRWPGAPRRASTASGTRRPAAATTSSTAPRATTPPSGPNQILAVSLPASPLSPAGSGGWWTRARGTSSPRSGCAASHPTIPSTRGAYGGGSAERDGAYHQGPRLGLAAGPVRARAPAGPRGPGGGACSSSRRIAHHLADYGVGSIAEIFEGDPPFAPRRLHRAGLERGGDAARLVRGRDRSGGPA